VAKKQNHLVGIDACVFDAYGTLFDFASAANACRNELGEDAPRLTALWRDKQLQYTWLRAAQGRHADFWQVTGDALGFALDVLRLDRPGLRDRLMAFYLTLSAYPEVRGVLERLKEADMRTAVLSNGTPTMLASIIAAADLGHLIDHTISVEEVAIFKPHPSVYQRAVDRLEVPPGRIAFQSANAWDIHAASAFGMRTVWCNRHGQPPERLPGAADWEMTTLANLPAALGLA
jgi:2-haloacid dehalogenase